MVYYKKKVKALNAVELFQKLALDLESNYMVKLLSIGSSSLDDLLGKRFQRSQTRQGNIGFKIPTFDEAKRMMYGVVHLGGKLHQVPSSVVILKLASYMSVGL